MTRRLISLALVLCFLLPWLPAFGAGKVYRASILVNKLGDERRVTVLVADDDILFAASDLAYLSDHKLTIKKNNLSLQRGKKTVTVNVKANELTCNLSKGKTKLKQSVVHMDGEYYLSGAQLLKWLNVATHFKKGMMIVMPNPVSIWDVTNKLSSYGFSTKDCAKIMGISESKVKKALNNKPLSKKDYYELLDDFFLDQSMTDSSTAQMREQMDTLAGLAEYGLQLYSELLPDDFGTNIFENMTKGGQELMSLIIYCSLFEENNDAKIEMMSSLQAAAKKSKNMNLANAADEISDTYTNFWHGLLYRAGNKLQDHVLALKEMPITSNVLLNALKVALVDSRLSGEWLKRYPGYAEMAKIALKQCGNGPGTNGYSDLKEYVYHAMLYLYASEQSYMGMIYYMLDEGCTQNQLNAMVEKAGRAEIMYGYYLACLPYLDSDRIDHKSHAQDYELMTKSFRNLELKSGDIPEARTAEMLTGLAVLRDMNIDSLNWTMTNTDNDENEELVLWGKCIEGSIGGSLMVLDGGRLGIITDESESGAEFCKSRSDGRFYAVKDDISYYPARSTVYEWNGKQWSPLMWKRTIINDQKEYCVNGVMVAREDYDKAYRALSLFALSFDCADYFEDHESGRASDILASLDEYYKNRAGKAENHRFDINGDGADDRVILLRDAAALWQKGIIKDTCSGEEIPCTFKDKAVTVIVAENEQSRVRLRVWRITPKDSDVFFCANGSLLIDGTLYNYQPVGLPYQEYVYQDYSGTDLMDLLGAAPAKVERLLDNYNEWGEPQLGMAEGDFYGEYTSITYFKYHDNNARNNYVVDVSLNNFYNHPAPVCGNVTLDQPARVIMAALPVLNEWEEPEVIRGYDGEVFGYSFENHIWYEPANAAYVVTILANDPEGLESPMCVMFNDANFIV